VQIITMSDATVPYSAASRNAPSRMTVMAAANVAPSARRLCRWVLADVCRAAGIDNPRNVAARLDDDEKGLHSMDALGGRGLGIPPPPNFPAAAIFSRHPDRSGAEMGGREVLR
jgi:hypothetical protein